ncbi:MAG: dCTP deaminase [Solirubrobacteraceae bacterium]
MGPGSGPAGEFCLGRTLEWIELPGDIVSRIEGKSSLGGLGPIVHATAGFCGPGWTGTLTPELSNLTRAPIKLYPGSHYQDQRAATESRYDGGGDASLGPAPSGGADGTKMG